MLSFIIPVFNEQEAIAETLHTAAAVLVGLNEPFEIVVVDDGSTDRTPEILRGMHISQMAVVTHPENRGYGSSLKTGIRRSHGDIIGMADADGTYPLQEFPAMLRLFRERGADMVVGARVKKGAQIPWVRRPAKAIVSVLANFLTDSKIPDVNSGLRVFTRALGERYMHLYPQGFSFTITITLAALTSGFIVLYHPIDYFKRKGTSTLGSGFSGIRNFFRFLGIIVRIVTYFRPLKFFSWLSASLLLTGMGFIIYTSIVQANVSDTGMLLFLSGLQIGLFGLIADMIVRSRVVS